MPVPLSPPAKVLLWVLQKNRHALTCDQLRLAMAEAGESDAMTTALAECIMHQLVRLKPTWSGDARPSRYELVP